MTIRLFFLFTLCAGFCAHAQGTYWPVKVVMQDGTQLTGEAEKPDWAKGTDRFLFRTQGDNSVQFLYTKEIETLSLDENGLERRYIGRAVQRLALPDTLLGTDSLMYTPDTLLLQAWVEGTASLYYYETPSGVPHYFLAAGDRLEELVQHRYYLAGSGRRIRKRHRAWQSQLEQVMGDCPAAIARLGDAVFEEEALKKRFLRYNNCGDGQSLAYEMTYPRSRGSSSFGALAGVAFTRVNTKDQQLNNIGTGQFAPRLGLQWIWHPNEGNGRSGYLFEAMYAPFRTLDEIDNIEVSANYLQLNAGLQHSNMGAGIFGSAQFGLSYAAQLGTPTLEGLPPKVFFDNQIGLFGGFSLRGKALAVSLRYELNNAGLLFRNAPPYFTHSLSLLAVYYWK